MLTHIGPNIVQAGQLSDYQVISNGLDWKVIQGVAWQTNQGRVIAVTNTVKVCGTGLYYTNPATGGLTEAKAEIESFPAGAVARQGRMCVIFAPDLATAGATDIEFPGGKRLRANVLGLRLEDGTNGVWISVLTNSCGGQIVGSNQVLYPGAFLGISADVLICIGKPGWNRTFSYTITSTRAITDFHQIQSFRCGQDCWPPCRR